MIATWNLRLFWFWSWFWFWRRQYSKYGKDLNTGHVRLAVQLSNVGYSKRCLKSNLVSSYHLNIDRGIWIASKKHVKTCWIISNVVFSFPIAFSLKMLLPFEYQMLNKCWKNISIWVLKHPKAGQNKQQIMAKIMGCIKSWLE